MRAEEKVRREVVGVGGVAAGMVRGEEELVEGLDRVHHGGEIVEHDHLAAWGRG